MKRIFKYLSVAGACISLSGCGMFKPANSADVNNAEALHVLSQSLTLLDAACVATAYTKDDADLAVECKNLYDQARTSLVVAENLSKLHDSVSQNNLDCAIKNAATVIDKMATLIETASNEKLSGIHELLKVADPFAARCK